MDKEEGANLMDMLILGRERSKTDLKLLITLGPQLERSEIPLS